MVRRGHAANVEHSIVARSKGGPAQDCARPSVERHELRKTVRSHLDDLEPAGGVLDDLLAEPPRGPVAPRRSRRRRPAAHERRPDAVASLDDEQHASDGLPVHADRLLGDCDRRRFRPDQRPCRRLDGRQQWTPSRRDTNREHWRIRSPCERRRRECLDYGSASAAPACGADRQPVVMDIHHGAGADAAVRRGDGHDAGGLRGQDIGLVGNGGDAWIVHRPGHVLYRTVVVHHLKRPRAPDEDADHLRHDAQRRQVPGACHANANRPAVVRVIGRFHHDIVDAGQQIDDAPDASAAVDAGRHTSAGRAGHARQRVGRIGGDLDAGGARHEPIRGRRNLHPGCRPIDVERHRLANARALPVRCRAGDHLIAPLDVDPPCLRTRLRGRTEEQDADRAVVPARGVRRRKTQGADGRLRNRAPGRREQYQSKQATRLPAR